MSSTRIWRGVRMRDTEAGADPDAPPRPLTLPATWDDRAAAALAALAPGEGPARLPRAADGWIRPLATRARLAGDAELADRLHALLLHRRAAPTAPIWGGAEEGTVPGFVLNLPAFYDAAAGLDTAAFRRRRPHRGDRAAAQRPRGEELRHRVHRSGRTARRARTRLRQPGGARGRGQPRRPAAGDGRRGAGRRAAGSAVVHAELAGAAAVRRAAGAGRGRAAGAGVSRCAGRPACRAPHLPRRVPPMRCSGPKPAASRRLSRRSPKPAP